jgi:BON domain-containing protein
MKFSRFNYGGHMCNPHNSAISIVLLSMLMGFSIACSHRTNDEKIAKDIQDKVASDPDTKDSQVNVAAKDGNVKLTGKVKSAVAQKKIEQIAHEEPGLADLDDETTVDQEAASSEQPTPPPAAAPPPVEKPKPQPIVVSAGTVLTVTTGQALGSKTSQTGQTFLATLAQPISVEGRPALPRGATVSGTVVSAKAKGKTKGEGELSLALTSISVGGHRYPIQTGVLSNTIKGKGKRTAATTGGGAAGGALIGGIAGGGKGAAIGAGVGAAAGFIGGRLTGNKQIEIPAESALSFTLAEPLTLPPPAE